MVDSAIKKLQVSEEQLLQIAEFYSIKVWLCK